MPLFFLRHLLFPEAYRGSTLLSFCVVVTLDRASAHHDGGVGVFSYFRPYPSLLLHLSIT